MRKATPADKTLVTDILVGAFDDNGSVNFIVKQDKHRQRRMRILMDYSFDICFMFGDVWLSEDNKACALILYPDRKRTTLAAILSDITLILKCIGIGNISKVMKREAVLRRVRGNATMACLWFIGVDTQHRYQGDGSKLLRSVIADCDLKKRPAYLETSTPGNLPWYEKMGFEIYAQENIGYRLFCLRKQIA